MKKKTPVTGLWLKMVCLSICSVVFAFTVHGEVETDTAIVSNWFHQISATDTNYFMAQVGIGTNAPGEKLHVVDGNIRAYGEISPTNGIGGYVYSVSKDMKMSSRQNTTNSISSFDRTSTRTSHCPTISVAPRISME